MPDRKLPVNPEPNKPNQPNREPGTRPRTRNQTANPKPRAANRVRTYLSFVRFSHSVFALPFALTGALLALDAEPASRRDILWRVIWIIAAMVAARSAAMGFNRLVDARYDAGNPRTSMRELPRGVMSRREAAIFVVVASIAFVISAWALGPVCFALSPVALAIVFWYSLAKRVTSYTQFFLALAMAVAPVGGWLAAGGRIGVLEPWLLGAAIGAWVGGFDILYACQDLDFDRAAGLKSIPVRFGVRRSLLLSRVMHVITVACLGALAALTNLGRFYLAGVAVVAALLVYEQSLVSEDDLSQVKRAFDLNGYVGILYFVSTAVSIYVR
jgi:4-hydroxybenzoate polyprenyltransferase